MELSGVIYEHNGVSVDVPVVQLGVVVDGSKPKHISVNPANLRPRHPSIRGIV